MNANRPHDPLNPTRRHKLAAIARQFWPLCRHVGAGMNPAWSPVGKVWHCVWPMLPAVTLALTLVLIAVVFPSCNPETVRAPEPSTLKPAPRTTAGVPIIRVLVTPSALDSVLIDTRGGYRLIADGRVLSESPSPMPRAQITRAGRTWNINNLHPSADVITIEAVGGQVRLGETLYCGSVCLRAASASGMVAINHVDLESYIAGVLPKEIYAYWAPETYRAVAIAARTFARYQMLNAGSGRDYDVGDNQGSQMYGGFTAATPKSWSAVRDSHGVMLAYGARGREKIFFAQYSACNGGVVNGAYVLREVDESEKIPPLAGGQSDPDGQKCTHYRWSPVRVSKADIFKVMRSSSYAAAARLTNVREVKVASETAYGRPIWLDVVDTAGNSVRLRADDLRLLLLRAGPKAAKELYSMNCRIRDLGDSIEFGDGKGFGHGVGLSQWGAEDKALQGWSPEKILQFYYPGAVLIRAY